MVRVTPILQALLMSQLAVVVDNFNNRNFYKSWTALRVLISISPDTVKEAMKRKLAVVQEEINAITSDKQQDINQQRATQTYRINLVCIRNLSMLIEETMSAFYTGGYLEFGRKEEGGFA